MDKTVVAVSTVVKPEPFFEVLDSTLPLFGVGFPLGSPVGFAGGFWCRLWILFHALYEWCSIRGCKVCHQTVTIEDRFDLTGPI